MTESAELWEFEPLERLSETMLRAPVAFSKAIAEAEQDLGPRLRRIERAVEAARAALTRAEARLEEARSRASHDDEDGSAASDERWAEEAVEEAEQALEHMKRAAEGVQHALSRYRNAARDMMTAGKSHFTEGARFLSEQVARARAYRAIDLSNGAPSASPAGGGVAASQSSGSSPHPYETELPRDFFWLPLDDVARADFLTDPGDWKKISKAEMEAGVRLLYDELLPLMAARPGITREELAALDRETGRVHPKGLVHPSSLANIFDVFFSRDDPVSAELHDDGRWRVQGRHRISVAAELGYTHIPARRQGCG